MRVGRTIPKLGTLPTVADPGTDRVEAVGADPGAGQKNAGASGSGASSTRLIVDEPMSLPEEVGDDRWGDLETPAYLHRRR